MSYSPNSQNPLSKPSSSPLNNPEGLGFSVFFRVEFWKMMRRCAANHDIEDAHSGGWALESVGLGVCSLALRVPVSAGSGLRVWFCDRNTMPLPSLSRAGIHFCAVEG